MEEERNLKLKQLSDARERQKREIQENKMRRVQLAESCEFFKSKTNFDFPIKLKKKTKKNIFLYKPFINIQVRFIVFWTEIRTEIDEIHTEQRKLQEVAGFFQFLKRSTMLVVHSKNR